ncbi:MAG: hypothetical protein JWQ87_1416 [Candidatus Sulfotelmatobacter sp.]|nr:hypothetical protein [Candidatus Sulfotelmatobacter sp.]
MQCKKLSGAFALMAILGFTPFAMTLRAAAQQEKVVHSFSPAGRVGAYPSAPLTFDAAGNLYGSTGLGGAYNFGTIFELMPAVSGGWTLKVLHNFGNGTDGQSPSGVLIFDTAGNLYGTTSGGGSHGNAGTVFKLSPQPSGAWKETILHSFNPNASDGYNPAGGVVLDASGNLYGTTNLGGSNNTGSVFKLSAAGGTWAETLLHSFGNSNTSDGQEPYLVQLSIDAAGNLYGTTEYGGAYKNGAVFEVSPVGGGGWTESVLYSFNPNSSEGYSPSSGVIMDSAGNLYGTLYFGGANNAGSVFKLSPASGGGWTETTIHNFKNDGIDGRNPAASLIFDLAGSLYGNTNDGGAYGYGTAFVLIRAGGGGWAEKLLHTFNHDGEDGYYPFAPLTLSALGILYGTTNIGGIYNEGTVFAIKP